MIQKKAIVTGANGFIGLHVCQTLAQCGVTVYAIIRDGSKPAPALCAMPNVVPLCCDMLRIADLFDLIPDRDVDVFYHFAWAGSAGASRSDEALQMRNALATTAALRVAEKMHCRKFVGAGSIMEQETLCAVYAPDTQPAPAYVYGAAKVAAHAMCKPLASTMAIDLCWAVITNAYGAGELSPRFINTTIRKMLRGEELRFTSAVQNYDFVYIDDVAQAFAAIGDHGKPNREYVIGSGQARPLKAFILEMHRLLAPKAPCLFGDIPFTGVSLPLEAYAIDALREDCGFVPKVSFAEGIMRTKQWLCHKED